MPRYSTTDFYTAAILIYKGHEIKEVTEDNKESSNKSRGSRKRFHFEESKELRQHIMEYMNGTIEGNLRQFRNAIESIKDLLYATS